MNARHQTDKATKVADANKQLVANFYAQVWNDKNTGAIARFVATDYIQHNPGIPNGRAPLEGFLSGQFRQMPESSFTIARLVANDDLVVAHCLFKADSADRGTAVVDVYRVEAGVLAEHWDVKEAIPEVSANDNPMV